MPSENLPANQQSLRPRAITPIFQLIFKRNDFYAVSPWSLFPGNHPEFIPSPAAIDPMVATAFATEAATSSGGEGIVYFGPSSAFGDTLTVGNYLRVAESEVGVPIPVAAWPTVAPHSVPVAMARAILQRMGKNVPEQIFGKSRLSDFLEENANNRMTPEEILRFQNEATQ